MSNKRTPLVAGNWKLHKNLGETTALCEALVTAVGQSEAVEVVVAPVFTALTTAKAALAGSRIGLSAQNLYFESSGAFTGEVSAAMLKDAGCTHVIIGHSERRTLFGESDHAVAQKTRAALEAGLTPIVCVGETLEEREAGKTEAVVLGQLKGGLGELSSSDLAKVVVAYEPVWAIGTGRTAAPSDAQAVHAAIRATLIELGSEAVGGGIRILYGGSVKPGNAKELMAEVDIDGALVGGASLDAESFSAIVAAAG